MHVKEISLSTVGVLMGGCSAERDISFKSGRAVCKALGEAGCKVIAVEINSTDEKEIVSLLEKSAVDVMFVALHGEFGEDGGIQAILEKMGIPYTGSDVRTSRLAMNKVLTKDVLNQNGMVLPRSQVISKNEDMPSEDILRSLGGLPLVVKPACGGSSIGITIVREKERLTGAMDLAFQHGQEIIMEQYVVGREIAAGILGEEALPLVEIRPKSSFFDFKAKYQTGMSDYVVPADIPDATAAKVRQTALAAYQDLGCRDFARVDFILDDQGNPFLLEINTIPGFTATSLLPMAAQRAGYGFGELCLKIVQFAMDRSGVWHNEKI